MHFRGVSGDTSKDDGRSEVDESGKVLRGVSGDTSTDTEDIHMTPFCSLFRSMMHKSCYNDGHTSRQTNNSVMIFQKL